MLDRSRIPRGITEFNGYITTTRAYFEAGSPITKANRLGIVETEVTQWKAFEDEWVPLYTLYVDKKSSRTTSIKDQLLAIIARTLAFNQTNHILDRISVSLNVTIVDLKTFHIKKGILQKSIRSFPQTPINELVTVTLLPLGGGSLAIKCYSTTDQRASIYKNADCVQYVCLVGDITPVSADVIGLTKDTSSKASFTLSLGSGFSGKYLYIYFRWYNIKHPELAGPWSALQTTLIL
jgi:hypothetical protein